MRTLIKLAALAFIALGLFVSFLSMLYGVFEGSPVALAFLAFGGIGPIAIGYLAITSIRRSEKHEEQNR